MRCFSRGSAPRTRRSSPCRDSKRRQAATLSTKVDVVPFEVSEFSTAVHGQSGQIKPSPAFSALFNLKVVAVSTTNQVAVTIVRSNHMKKEKKHTGYYVLQCRKPEAPFQRARQAEVLRHPFVVIKVPVVYRSTLKCNAKRKAKTALGLAILVRGPGSALANQQERAGNERETRGVFRTRICIIVRSRFIL